MPEASVSIFEDFAAGILKLQQKWSFSTGSKAFNLRKHLPMPAGFSAIKRFFSKVWFLWALCLLFNIITFLLIFYKIRPGDKTMALHYNVLAGVEWYGKASNLYLIPGAGLAVTFANFVLYNVLKKTDYFFNFLIIFAALSVQLVLLLSVLLLLK